LGLRGFLARLQKLAQKLARVVVLHCVFSMVAAGRMWGG